MAFVVLMAACNGDNKSVMEKRGSSGKTLEVLFVSEKDVYSGSTKALVDSLFCSPQEGLLSPEPMFDLVNLPTSSFRNTDMFQVHRNVIMCDIHPENPNKVFYHRDPWSAPQVVFDFAVKDRETLDSMLLKYHDKMLQEIYRAEHLRVIKAYNSQAGKELRADFRKQFGFGLAFSNEFSKCVVANPTDDFAWIRKEAKDFSIGILVKVIPYEDKHQFDESVILDRIDSMMVNVQGPADGSYMGLEKRVGFTTKQIEMGQSSYSVETRGCWRLFGDFMGGPFVSYSLLSPDGRQLITLCGYTYSPRFPKRDYLMQMESLCYSISFDK